MWTSAGVGAFPGPASEGISGPRPSAKWVSPRWYMGSEGVVSGSCLELIEYQISLSSSPHLKKQVIYYCGASLGMKVGAMRSGARWE